MAVNLITKTEYSMMKSLCRIDALVERAKEYGYQAMAITDSGNMHGVIKFYQACQKAGIKPIIGLEIQCQYNNRLIKLCLYAMNTIGYHHLMSLASRSKLNDNVVDFEYLRKVNIGVLVIIPTSLQFTLRDANYLHQLIVSLQSDFNPVYLGIAKQTDQDYQNYQAWLDLAKQNHVAPVAYSECAFLDYEDMHTYEVLSKIANEPFDNVNKALWTPEEYGLAFPDTELLQNTEVVSKLCNVEIDFQHYHVPKYGFVDDASQYLRELCLKGLQKRLKSKKDYDQKSYFDRLNYELDVIKKTGFCDYFLIVWDFVKYAKGEGIYVGAGRGSAPASLVAYSLGITDIDPLQYGLLFERFLNTERLTMPDIDIDFPDDERDLVIQYVGKRYGETRVAHIVTFNCFAARSAIRDVAKVCQLSDIKLKELLKYLPQNSFQPLAKVLENSHDLQVLLENHNDLYEVFQIALRIEGLPRNTSTHAAGIIMCENELTNYTPLDLGMNGIYLTQYEAADLEALGLLKMDFLGLRNLTNIRKCLDLIKKDEPNFELPRDYNDKKTYQLISQGQTTGIFQLESSGMRQLLVKMQPSTFEDIVSAIALYRPGPMDIIPVFLKRKFKQEQVTYPHPDLAPFLEYTYGTIVYQDQILLIAWKFAGYTLGEADVLRRAVSKKKEDVLIKERVRFVSATVKKGYTREVGEQIYDYIVKFANYGFNRAHAVSYAVIAYQTAYLKANYLKYYLAVLLSSVIGIDSMTSDYIKDAKKHKIEVLPPNINLSTEAYLVKDNQIILPLSTINGLGAIKVHALLEERKKGLFSSYEDFVLRTKDIISLNIIENIIYSGALDDFGLTKKAMIANIQTNIQKSDYDFMAAEIVQVYNKEEYSYGELLEKERSTIGINLKYNLFYNFAESYQNGHLVKISDINDGQYLNILGIVRKIREIKTKEGASMAFMEIFDDTGNLEVTIFPRTYASIQKPRPGQILECRGKITLRNGQLQMALDEIKRG